MALEIGGNHRRITNPSERQNLAIQLLDARQKERTKIYTTDRSGDEYSRCLGGLKYFFEHVQTLSSHSVLDIGAGTTRAIHQISQKSEASGIEFYAAGLSTVSLREGYLPKYRVHLTPAESLRGFEDKSMGGIIAVYSLCYSTTPRLAAERIDDLLVPGGVIKAVFPNTVGENHPFYPRLQTDDGLMEALNQLGYDTADSWTHSSSRALIAVKPADFSLPTASDLLKKDLEEQEYDVSDKEFMKKMREKFNAEKVLP